MNPHSAVAWKDGRLISIPPSNSGITGPHGPLCAGFIHLGAAKEIYTVLAELGTSPERIIAEAGLDPRLFDDGNNPIDYRFLEVNRVFEKQTGMSNAVGRRVLEIALRAVASGAAVIAIGGEWGTLAEIAFARMLDRPVVALESWSVSGAGSMREGPGVVVVASADEAVESALKLAGAGR